MVIHHILCPIDFSECSDRALHHAAAIARWYEADLHIFHALEPVAADSPVLVPMGPVSMDEVRASADSALRDFVRKTDLSGIKVHGAVHVDRPVTAITAHARAIPADLIVLGTHGWSGFDRFLMGSTTERVLARAPCAVLTIPPAAHEPESRTHVVFKRILCALDFSPSALRAFEHGLSLAQENDGRLTLLHVLETLSDEDARLNAHFRVAEYVRARREEALRQLQAVVSNEARMWCETSQVVEVGAPAQVILRVAKELDADLIVMGSQGRGGLGLMLFGSTTHTVIRRATCPVLTARARN